MKSRLLLMTAAVSFALAGLAGCNRDADHTSRAPDTTTPPASTTPAPTTPPAGTTTPPAGDAAATGSTTPGATTSTERTAGQTVDDASVTAKVKAALLAESGVDGTKINVDTFNGRVTLKGEVPNQSQIDKATQVARGIEGVKDVDNRLSAGGAG